MIEASAGSDRTRRVTALALFSMAALVWVLVARIVGPSDIWDQTQPKTIAYTTDIVVHGGSHWILPIERGEFPATKPPLYNWLAAPFVKLLGFNNDLAHKFPSVIALCVSWLLIVRLGRSLDPDPSQNLGWLASLALVCNYTFFKLGYLARPDMLLTLWLMLAWMIATHFFVQHAARSMQHSTRATNLWLVATFWMCIALAALTKGPPAIVGVLYAIFAARAIGGSWSAIRILHPAIGLLGCALVVGAWIFAVWRINPDHLQNALWYNEILGRVTGTGPEGSKEGLYGWLRTSLHQLIYFVVRFLPWSIAAILMMIGLFDRRSSQRLDEVAARGPVAAHASGWLWASFIWVVLVIAIFTLSTSKRADYIAAAFGPGSLLASWWLLRWPPFLGVRWQWFAPAAAVITLAAMTVVNQQQPAAPAPEYGARIKAFVEDVEAQIQSNPLPVAFCWTGDGPVQALLGYSKREGPELVAQTAQLHSEFWLVTTRPALSTNDIDDRDQHVAELLRSILPADWKIEMRVDSPALPWRHRHPHEHMTLYRVKATEIAPAK